MTAVNHPRPNAHPVCGGCYIEKVSARLPRDTPVLEWPQRCCRCNRPTSALLYYGAPPMWMFVPHCAWAVKP